MQRERFLVKSSGDNEDGARVGLRKLFELAGTHKSSVIVVPAFTHIKNSMFATVLPEPLAKVLIKDRKVTLDNGHTVELCSQATLKNFQRADAYLSLWGSTHAVEDVEALTRWTSHILVAWIPADAEKWAQANAVQVI